MMAAVIACDDLRLSFSGSQKLGEADARVVAHLVEHPDRVLRRQIAGSARSEGATAQAAQSRLDLRDAASTSSSSATTAMPPLSRAAREFAMPSPRVSWK